MKYHILYEALAEKTKERNDQREVLDIATARNTVSSRRFANLYNEDDIADYNERLRVDAIEAHIFRQIEAQNLDAATSRMTAEEAHVVMDMNYQRAMSKWRRKLENSLMMEKIND